MKKYGYLDRVISYLRDNDTQSIVFDKILPNPILEHVTEGAELAKQESCDFVVGCGGGAVIDSQKSIAMMAKKLVNIGLYVDSTAKGRILRKARYQCSYPTTLGQEQKQTLDCHNQN